MSLPPRTISRWVVATAIGAVAGAVAYTRDWQRITLRL